MTQMLGVFWITRTNWVLGKESNHRVVVNWEDLFKFLITVLGKGNDRTTLDQACMC